MASFSVTQIIGKTMLTGSKPVKAYRLPQDGQPVFFEIAPNQVIGTTYSYFLPKAGRLVLYWGFEIKNGGFFYIKHDSSNLRLTDSSLTIIEETELQKDFLQKIADQFTEAGTIQSTVVKIATVAGIAYGAKVLIENLPKILKRK